MTRRSILVPHFVVACTAALVAWPTFAWAQSGHANPIVDLLAAHKPVFGLYAPSNRRPPQSSSATMSSEPPKSAAELARMALAYPSADFIFDGSMEGDFEKGFSSFSEFAKGLAEGGMVQGSPLRFRLPTVVKMNEIAPDPAGAATRIARQLNLGVSTVVFVGVESVNEVKTGLLAMRFRSHGGTRPNEAGDAPARWGMSAAEYQDRADLWPLNPKGELVNWTIVESKEGLAHVREIAAVPGIGVLFPGAGTLRGVFSSTDSSGKRVVDTLAWEAAIQQVLAACKEFKVACGYPANANDIEMRMRQGFSVFVIGWGESGFKTIDIGRRVSGRATADNSR
ncbi:MAG: aldolase/citrate lyase family protein [Gemmatimonadaceae bacterium]